MKKKKKTWFIGSLLEIAKADYLHFLWLIFTIVFGSLSFWISCIINGWNYANAELQKNGSLYISSIGILAPCVFSLLYKICATKTLPNYTRQRVVLVLLGIVFCSLVPVFSLGIFCSLLLLQWGLFLIVVVYSFFCYLAVFLVPDEDEELHGNAFNDANIETSEIMDQSERINSIDIDGVKIEL